MGEAPDQASSELVIASQLIGLPLRGGSKYVGINDGAVSVFTASTE